MQGNVTHPVTTTTKLCCVGAGLWLLCGVALADWQRAEQAWRQGDFVTALQEWRALAQAGDVPAQYNTAILLLDGAGQLADPAAALEWLQRAATGGSLDARFCLGYLHAEGRVVPRDDERAADWYRMAACACWASRPTARPARRPRRSVRSWGWSTWVTRR